jgi:hypothetical protein
MVIEDQFAQELVSLLQIVSPFDSQSAAYSEFNNSTVDCPSEDLGSCQRCQISIDKQPSPSQQICATCPYYSEDNNSVSYQVMFVMDTRIQSQHVAKLSCQPKGCNSIDNVNRVDKGSKQNYIRFR